MLHKFTTIVGIVKVNGRTAVQQITEHVNQAYPPMMFESTPY